ncbi:MAG: M23 family metallopeptidase [Chlorobi bacterium]|nr:M23 family metallopeptidase [Chlorobiota bacterium]
MAKFSLKRLRKSSLYITPNFPVIHTKRYKISFRRLFFFTFIFTAIISTAVILILMFTPLKKIVLIFENERLAKEQKTIEKLEDKVVFLTKELDKIASTNRRLKYALLLGITDSMDTNSVIMDSLRSPDEDKPQIGGSIYFAALRFYNYLFADSTGNIFFIKPVNGFVTNSFLPKKGHMGVDFSVKTGTPVYASAGGQIIFADFTTDYGYVLIIDHGDNYLSIYKHCSSLVKKEREYVRQGEVIALSGNSGIKSTGPHLHFEIWNNGKPIDPEKILIKNR